MKARSTSSASAIFALSLFLSACGYHAVSGRGGEAFHVALAKSGPVRSEVRREVELGIRDALVKEDALLVGDGYPALEYEVLDSLDAPTAIGAIGGTPSAGGVRVRLRGRAWIRKSKDAEPERDTGDRSSESVVAAEGTALGANAELRGGELAAARTLGIELARSVLGVANVAGE